MKINGDFLRFFWVFSDLFGGRDWGKLDIFIFSNKSLKLFIPGSTKNLLQQTFRCFISKFLWVQELFTFDLLHSEWNYSCKPSSKNTIKKILMAKWKMTALHVSYRPRKCVKGFKWQTVDFCTEFYWKKMQKIAKLSKNLCWNLKNKFVESLENMEKPLTHTTLEWKNVLPKRINNYIESFFIEKSI